MMKIEGPDPHPDPFVRGLSTDPDPHQNVMDPQHWLASYIIPLQNFDNNTTSHLQQCHISSTTIPHLTHNNQVF
jgi:hypothetical protein